MADDEAWINFDEFDFVSSDSDSEQEEAKVKANAQKTREWLLKSPKPKSERFYQDKQDEQWTIELPTIGVMCDTRWDDVDLVVDGKIFPCHRVILAGASPYFEALLSTLWTESNQRRVVLQGVRATAVRMVLEYIYLSTLNFSEHNVVDFIVCADFFQMTPLVAKAVDFLRANITDENVFSVFQLTYMFGQNAFYAQSFDENLLEAARHHILRNFDSACLTNDWLTASSETVADILSWDGIFVENEQKVAESLMRWLHHDEENREPYVEELLKLIRFPYLKPFFIIDCLHTDVLLHDSLDARKILDRAIDQTEGFINEPRNYGGWRSGLIFVCGGITGRQARTGRSPVEVYSPSNNKWTEIAPMKTVRDQFGLVELNSLIYCIGGYNGTHRLNCVEIYNQKTKTWKMLSPMRRARSAFGCIAVEGKIFVIGGIDGQGELKTTEIYNPNTDKWMFGPDLNNERSRISCTRVENKIYVVGGSTGGGADTRNDFETLNITKVLLEEGKGNWSLLINPLSMLEHKARAAGCTTLHGKLYVAGGNYWNSVSKPMMDTYDSLHCYDPGSRTWTKKASMKTKRTHFSLVPLGGKLYAIGGLDYKEGNLFRETRAGSRTMEIYTPETDSWQYGPEMVAHCGYISAIQALTPPYPDDLY